MSGEQQLLPRDRLLRDEFTPAEFLLFVTILVTAITSFWIGNPRSFWVLGLFIIAGLFSPIILNTHQRTHPFFIDRLWTKVLLFGTPSFVIAALFLIGLQQHPFEDAELDGRTYFILNEINYFRPVTATTFNNWVTVLGYCSLYIVAINLIIIPKSRAFFERLIPWLCLNAVLVCLFGLLQKTMHLKAPIGTSGTGMNDFFAYFPYIGHWSAFATVWSCVCFAMALLLIRQDGEVFNKTVGPWYLTGGIILGLSALWVTPRWPAVIQLITFTIMLIITATKLHTESRDQNKTSFTIACNLLAVFSFITAIFRLLKKDEDFLTAEALRLSAKEMFLDSPIFGWGIDSFSRLTPFYTDDFLVGKLYTRAPSDFYQILAEIGIVGCIAPVAIILFLLIRYLRWKTSLHLTNHLLISCVALLTFTFFDCPFISPAVMFSFWIVFFIAMRWAILSRFRSDEADSSNILVVPAQKRRVPFFSGTHVDERK